VGLTSIGKRSAILRFVNRNGVSPRCFWRNREPDRLFALILQRSGLHQVHKTQAQWRLDANLNAPCEIAGLRHLRAELIAHISRRFVRRYGVSASREQALWPLLEEAVPMPSQSNDRETEHQSSPAHSLAAARSGRSISTLRL
jgi:hypothetical protein